MSAEINELELNKHHSLSKALFYARNVTELDKASVTLRNIYRLDKDGEVWQRAFQAMYDIIQKQVLEELSKLNASYQNYKYLEAKLNSRRLVK